MDVNLSEEEQVEELKKWWKENGKSVIAGIVLGLGGVFGWQYWTQHEKGIAEQASFQFEQLRNSVSANASEVAIKQAEGLISEHKESTYATFAALNLAKVKLQLGENKAAREQLQWAIDNTDDDSLKQIARLRLGRLMLSDGDVDSAATIIAQATVDSFQGDFSELRGDIALSKGDKAAARQAYQEALAQKASNPVMVQMKFDDLAANANP
ncbi:YfgM family protein [Candidatus Vondammii sp. HM_W22]|uniref:YfgM family protein n=1 Tax=Candidatus Vondammii sp. HM_W22 TaxID=2687299 RepID=UPI001F12C9E0|nr:tetratricopeptide repeat protein [Candidatus Vondammii sp. HM_W22]